MFVSYQCYTYSFTIFTDYKNISLCTMKVAISNFATFPLFSLCIIRCKYKLSKIVQKNITIRLFVCCFFVLPENISIIWGPFLSMGCNCRLMLRYVVCECRILLRFILANEKIWLLIFQNCKHFDILNFSYLFSQSWPTLVLQYLVHYQQKNGNNPL